MGVPIAIWIGVSKEKQAFETTVFNQLRNGIRFTPTNNPEIMKATYGNGAILMGKDLNELLSFAGVRREQMTDKEIHFVRRETAEGYNYFIVNHGKSRFEGWLPLKAEASSAEVFNLMTGKSGITGSGTGKDGKTEVYVQLNPDESLLVTTYNKNVTVRPYLFCNAALKPLNINGI